MVTFARNLRVDTDMMAIYTQQIFPFCVCALCHQSEACSGDRTVSVTESCSFLCIMCSKYTVHRDQRIIYLLLICATGS